MATLAASGTDIGGGPALPKALLRALPASDESWKLLLADKVILGVREHSVSIGRSSASMVQIGSTATTISRRHAEISRTNRGCYELRVLGMNGVRVNGMLHGRGASVELCSEDELNFVGIRYRFRAPAADAAPGGEAEEWWPEPVRKHAADPADCPPGPPHKRARTLASSASEALYHDSTDTLIGGSEVGLYGADSSLPELAPQQQLLDGLPPSSPPPMHALAGMFYSEDEGEGEDADDLPGALDIESLTPMQSLVATPQATTPQATTPPAVAATPTVPPGECAPKAARVAPVVDRSAAKETKKNNKENASTSKEGAPVAGKAAKQRKPRKSAGEQRKPDDEMMASLRELLGIVDPSEGLADSIDSETEIFLTTRPEEPIELA
ncbi:hypothetical protein H4R19_005606, partial [Coemansia spiralis]